MKDRRVAIIHPDMGIGGAEQLMLNIALSLQKKDYEVTIYTPRFDPNHCFQELKDNNLPVKVHGNLFPRHIFNRCFALCAYIRMLLCTLYVIFFCGRFQLIVLDQVPLPIPFIRLFTRAKIIFYCHHPDKLLCTERSSFLKRAYRWVIDTVEEHTMAKSHEILVNSKYTQRVFYDSFPLMAKGRRACCCCCKAPKSSILYPCIDVSIFKENAKVDIAQVLELNEDQRKGELKIVSSLNRYERKKNLALAIEAFALYLNNASPTEKECALLIIAGGYDQAVLENVEHYNELVRLANEKHIPHKNIRFLRSVSNAVRTMILQKSDILLYTPSNEHFGIVPLEAMYCNAVVIACNSGGPLETVVDKRTGYLLEPQPQEWANKITELLRDPIKVKTMGEEGQEHVKKNFTIEAFGNQLEKTVVKLLKSKSDKKTT